MTSRLTRAERTERVRADLLVAARHTFLSRGFHQASLEEIALAAGWSKGAVFSNFAGKDELFLAVLDDQNRRRRREQIAEMQVAPTLAEALLAAGREMAGAHARDPQWTPLLVEFWTHASRDDALRARVSAAHEDLLDGYARRPGVHRAGQGGVPQRGRAGQGAGPGAAARSGRRARTRLRRAVLRPHPVPHATSRALRGSPCR